MNFSLGRCCLEFTQALSSVALAWHKAGGSTPLGVTIILGLTKPICNIGRWSNAKHENHKQQRLASKGWVEPQSKARHCILAEGAIALSVTLSGGALFAS